MTEKRAFLLAVLLLALMLAGCTRRVYVPVENVTVRCDTVRLTAWRCDTIMMRDSVTTLISGDTVTREVVRERLRIRSQRDTVRLVSTDTVVRNVVVPAEAVSRRPKSRLIPFLIIMAAVAVTVILFRRK